MQARLDKTQAKLNEFQYPSSRVILPDSLSLGLIGILSVKFQYPSSRVILPDEVQREAMLGRTKCFNTPVVG